MINKRSFGVMMLAAMVVTMMTALIAVSILFRMQSESAATAAVASGDQAYSAAMSGIHMSIALLSAIPEDETAESTPAVGAEETEENLASAAPKPVPVPSLWYDSEELFKNRLVYDDGANKWYFTVWARNWQDAESVRFGLTDEAGKININAANEQVLAAMPNMTTELVHALMDYRDRDDETRDEGAEQDHYDQLRTPYLIKNGPLGSVEELFMVKGFDATIIYGEDANRNGLLEPNEDDGDENFPLDNNDGILDGGLYEMATTSSTDLAVDSEGNPQININGNPNQTQAKLKEIELSDETIAFITTYRSEGNSFKHPSELLNMSYTTKGQQGGRGRGNNNNNNNGAGRNLNSGVTVAELPLILDKLTTTNERVPKIGLLNINSASPKALAALEEIDDSLAETIVATRATLDDESKKTTAWLLTEGVMEEEDYKKVAPKLTSRGFQYHIRVIGFGVPSARYRILEAIIDISGAAPRITYLRDVTSQGVPFPLTIDEEAAN